LPDEHCDFVVHDVPHVVLEHLNVPQSPLPAVQLPDPLHAPICV